LAQAFLEEIHAMIERVSRDKFTVYPKCKEGEN
jgi:hypothetical protein